ncbi:unnamed protein product [Calicophoron daubneyi]|uniref:Metallo-beta-lactamase domain-containing protein n=1 Tax=Calicophoron daubneyi TaxID=300641 RepID=A0AAV2TNC2_CALDB
MAGQNSENLITDLGLKLGPIIDTHLHADHVTGSGQLKKRFPGSYSVDEDYKKVRADQKLKHGDRIRFGNFEIECRSTPGHTSSCLTLVMHKVGAIFTGDTLFVRGCGRTDFPGSSAEQLHDSVHAHIFSLPDEYLVFPGHDYAGFLYTTVGEEKIYNPLLRKSKEEFIEIMKNLKLDLPKQIKRASQLNPVGGIEN